MIRRYSRNCVH